MLDRQLNGPSGAFVEPYVLAHEYGHHIQNLTGATDEVRTQQGPKSDAVRLELQADCYAGMWAGRATSTDDASGQALIADLTQEDIAQAVAAAKAVGDDRIQKAGRARRPGGLDPRVGRAAGPLVHDRLRAGQPGGLRHVLRRRRL